MPSATFSGSPYDSDETDSTPSPESDSPPHVFDEDAALYGDDDPSLEELEDDDFPDYFIERNERLYPSEEDSVYPLPVDTPESERLNLNHKILKQLIGRNFRGPVNAVLALNPARPPRVLDLGTGKGKWLLEMSAEFPHAQFFGVDIVPIATRYPPPNVQFELANFNERQRWDDAHFDFIHARDVLLGVPDYNIFLDEVARLLRPGGLFLSVEWTYQPTIHPRFQDVHIDQPPASIRFFSTINQIIRGNGGGWLDGVQAANTIASSTQFTNIIREQILVPIGPWEPNEVLNRIGSTFRTVHEKLAITLGQTMVDSGMPPPAANMLVSDYIAELQMVGGLISVAHITYARRV